MVNPGTAATTSAALGAASSTAPSAPVTPSGPTPPQQGNALKTILLVGAVLVGLVIVGIITTIIVGVNIAKHTRVTQEGDKVHVETPFGTVDANQDPETTARNLGIEIYPGARAMKDNSATIAIGGMKTVAAQFESDDPLSKVADFYKKKLPNANVTERGSDHVSIVRTNGGNVLTIDLKAANGGTQIKIANVQKGDSASQ